MPVTKAGGRGPNASGLVGAGDAAIGGLVEAGDNVLFPFR